MAEPSKSPFEKPPPPRFAMITPSASPPVSRSASKKPRHPPAKRPRLASTPSSSISSFSRSTPVSAADLVEQSLHDARRASSQRVMSIWDSLAERYARPLDEDDIIDLRSGAIIKDRGVMRKVKKTITIGHFAGEDPDEAASTGGETEEADTDADPLDAFGSDTGIPEELELEKNKREVPPVQAINPKDAEDLKEFLEAEELRRELCGADDEDDVEDQGNVLGIPGSDDWLDTDGEDGEAEVEEDSSEGSDVPLETGFARVRRVQAERALTLAEDSDSGDEFATWSEGESPLAPTTPRRIVPPKDDIIDLTTPSPPTSRGREKSGPGATRPPSNGPSRAKSKTPTARKIRAVTPPRSSLPIIQLRTPPRSQSQSFPPDLEKDDTPPSKLPSPPPSSPSHPTPRPRPKPTPVFKGPFRAQSSTTATFPSSPSADRGSVKLKTPRSVQSKTPSVKSKPKLVAEVVLLPRAASRARSLAPTQPSKETTSLKDNFETAIPSTPHKDKGKARDLSGLSSGVEPPKVTLDTAVIDDSPSPPRPQRWKPKFQRSNHEQLSPLSTPTAAHGKKRKRIVSSSSRSGESSPDKSTASVSLPLPAQEKPTELSPQTRSKTKARSISKPKATSDDEAHEKLQRQSKPRSSSNSSAAEPSTNNDPNSMYPYSAPYTPHRNGKDRHNSGLHSQYPPIPPMLPIQDPQAQYYFAQAVHHLSYLMSGALPPPPAGYKPPYPLQYPQQPWPPNTPPRRGRRDKDDSPSSSSPIASSSQATAKSPFKTPTHQSHPYPFTFDPTFSNGTLPPSSPPPSSPSPSSAPERRPALARHRSKSRGRRVSFKLDDDERPRVHPEEEEPDASADADTSMHSVHMASPEAPRVPRERSQSRGRQTSPSARHSSPKMKFKRSAVTENEEPRSRTERGRTPGP